MQYINRTIAVKEALLKRDDLLDNIRLIFQAHFAGKGIPHKGQGTTRIAYEAGSLEIPEGHLNLLLKLPRKAFYGRFEFEKVGELEQIHHIMHSPIRIELGLFEIYFEYVCGVRNEIRFSEKKYRRYLKLRDRFDLEEVGRAIDIRKFEDPVVAPGDLGAIPYFHMIIVLPPFYGILTEGSPPLIKPLRGMGRSHDTEGRIKYGRVIDLSPYQSRLAAINDYRYRGYDFLGLKERGRKYFEQRHRIDLN